MELDYIAVLVSNKEHIDKKKFNFHPNEKDCFSFHCTQQLRYRHLRRHLHQQMNMVWLNINLNHLTSQSFRYFLIYSIGLLCLFVTTWTLKTLACALHFTSDHAVCNMIVNQPHSLHEGIHRGGAEKFPAQLFQIL